ncbi:MAG: hypothetical protein Q7T11_08560 [Deltaproteobacteria bacterium]|nr:hypothetical protein [Deltaproteobacteria bacterium]
MIDLFPNETLPIMWAFFMVALVALTRLVFKPTLSLIEERENKTNLMKKEAGALLEKVRGQLASYEESINRARLKGAAERESIIKATREEERGIVGEARKENEAALDEIRKSLAKEKEKALTDLKMTVAALARGMADAVMEKKKEAA